PLPLTHLLFIIFCFSLLHRPTRYTLFPYTTLFRSMAMGHVILNEYYHQSKTKYFEEYAKKYTDFPFSVLIKEENGTLTADRFLKDRKSTRLNSSHVKISYAVFCLKKKKL